MTSHMLGRIIPTDELIFFRGVGIPPTRYIHPYLSLWKRITRAITYRKGVLSVMFVIKCDKTHINIH